MTVGIRYYFPRALLRSNVADAPSLPSLMSESLTHPTTPRPLGIRGISNSGSSTTGDPTLLPLLHCATLEASVRERGHEYINCLREGASHLTAAAAASLFTLPVGMGLVYSLGRQHFDGLESSFLFCTSTVHFTSIARQV